MRIYSRYGDAYRKCLLERGVDSIIAWIPLVIAVKGSHIELGAPKAAKGRWLIRQVYSHIKLGSELGNNPASYVETLKFTVPK